MLYGYLVNGVVVVSDESSPGARQVSEVEPPLVPEGYVARCRWMDDGARVYQSWSVEPAEGTAQDAAVRLARAQAESLPDDQALEVMALYDEWREGVKYEEGQRRRHKGVLYRCLQDHTSQTGWEPPSAPSLWARVLPGQSGEVGPWEQPDSTNGYREGDRVTHDGHLWESTADDNVWRPGDVGAPWKDLGEWPQGGEA